MDGEKSYLDKYIIIYVCFVFGEWEIESKFRKKKTQVELSTGGNDDHENQIETQLRVDCKVRRSSEKCRDLVVFLCRVYERLERMFSIAVVELDDEPNFFFLCFVFFVLFFP